MKDHPELNLLESPIDPGLTVIEASAGTGKTYSISHLVPRLLLAGDLPDLSKLLLVTFTKDAARELAERVRRVLLQLAAPAAPDEKARHPHVAGLRDRLADAGARARLSRALIDLDLLAVSTIHAFCQRTLQQEGSLCGLPVMPEVITDDEEHLVPLVRERWFARLAQDPTVAALAAAQGWKLESATKFINSRRRCHHPSSEPPTPAFPELRTSLAQQIERLAEAGQVASVRELIGRVPRWNKTVGGPAQALAPIATLATADATSLAYWQALELAEAVPEGINRQSPAGKAASAEAETHPWFAAAEALRTLARRLEWAWHHELADAALGELSRVLEARRVITQDGLIGTLFQALHRPTADGAAQSARLADHLAQRYHIALIDESQDTDPRQFAIFRRIFLESAHRRRLILVGDPKQAIYGFRGADLGTYLAARAQADHVYTLLHTHRAPQPLVATLNRLFVRDGAFHHADMRFQPAESALPRDRQLLRDGAPCSRLEAWIVPEADARRYSAQGRRRLEISARVASAIVDLLHHGTLRTVFHDGRTPEETPVSPRDFAVLVSTNVQAAAMAEALQARAVPVVVNSGADVFDSDEARELHTLLEAILDPRRTRRLRAALATRLLGLDARSLADLDAPATDGAQPAVVWFERFTRWNQLWAGRGLAGLFSELERPETAITHRLALVPLTGERRATNYRHLTDLLLEAARDEAPRPAEIVRWLGQQITRAEDRSRVEEHQLQLSSDREAVQIVTMHKAKGLEYPLVFCPYLADSLQPPEGVDQLPSTRSPDDAANADVLVNLDLLDEAERLARARQLSAARLEERLRLAYVALTRAQVRVWICSFSGAPRTDHGSALDWLLRADDEIKAYPTFTDAWAAAARDRRGARHARVLHALAAADPASLCWGEPPPATADRFSPRHGGPTPTPAPAARPAPAVPPSWRITSFSTLTREKHAHGTPSGAGPRADGSRGAAAGDPPPPRFLGAPGGAAVGTAVHDWIERWDLGPVDRPALRSHLATAQLPALAAGGTGWEEILADLFTTLREIRLPGLGESPLHALCPEPHGSEWNFHLPIAGALSARDLARCFALHAAPAHRPYAAALQELSEERFHGLLQGFIDRLARRGPQWGVIDWKTNRLGPDVADYDEAGLLGCATKDHYLLQTHLYLVALRRYLRALGLADPPLAGAWLVFLRAIAPHGTRGVLHVNPPAEMLDALDALFAPAGHELR